MPHATPLIATIVGGLGLAFILGTIAHRLRMPPLVGYLIAGVLVGPYTPGFVADQTLAPELAEIGVILLMFGVGLHFSLKDLMSVKAIAVPGAVVQIAFATLLGWLLGLAMGWSTGGSLVFGLALSVASTVVLLKALQERRLVQTERGTIAVGWLIVEDLAMVLALVLIPAFASASAEFSHDPLALVVARWLGHAPNAPVLIALTFVKVVAFVAIMLVVGRRVIPWILHVIAHTGSRELFRLGVLAIALGTAFGSAKLFGVSFALGAFFAGMILSESELSNRAAQESLPLRDAFAVLFFVSVGMLFNPGIILERPLSLFATIFIILIGKSIAAFVIVLLFRRTIGTALTISASLSQIGEFSFILAELGVGLKLLPEAGRDLILAGAILSIMLNPVMFLVCDFLKPRLEARFAAPAVAVAAAPTPPKPAGPIAADRAPTVDTSTLSPAAPAAAEVSVAPRPDVATLEKIEPPEAPPAAAEPDESVEAQRPTQLKDHIVLVGYGRVGSLVGQDLRAAGVSVVVVEDADTRVEAGRKVGWEVIAGNAADAATMALVNIRQAYALVLAIPDAFEAGTIVQTARKANPRLLIIGRAHSDAEVEHLTKLGADTVIMGEREIALGMVRHLGDGPHHETAAEAAIREAPATGEIAAAATEAPSQASVAGPLPDAPETAVFAAPADGADAETITAEAVTGSTEAEKPGSAA